MPHVILKDKGFKNFTGLFGQFEFKNGRSVESIPEMEAERLGSITVIETDEGRNPSPSQKQIDSKSYRANTERATRKMTEAESEASLASSRKSVKKEKDKGLAKPDVVEEGNEVVDEVVDESQVDEAQVDEAGEAATQALSEGYDRKELEAIADKHGMAGLREVGEELGVKSNSIPGLIENIMAAQETK